MVKADLIIYNIGELVYFTEPVRKINDGNTKILHDYGIAIKDGKILEIGNSEYIKTKYESQNIINAEGNLVTSGLIDMHTHALFAGSREDELYKKLLGISYAQILKEGGGIYKTVKSTRDASFESLKNRLDKVLMNSLSNGTTTIEIKSGYGLDLENEIKMLKVINNLKDKYDIVPTLLAHVIPKEFNEEEYIDYFINKIIPEVSRLNLAKYVDVFCDENVFNMQQTRKIFNQSIKYGFRLRLHADQLKYIGCSKLINEFLIDSIDHLENCPEENLEEISKTNTVIGLLPASTISMLSDNKPRIKPIKGKALFALGSDFSANSPMISMQTAIDLAIYYLNFTPIEALAFSTINSAYSLRLENKGTIREGYDANLLIWDLENINQLGYYWGYNRIKKIVYRGNVINGSL
ncbi:imidazolonepropionase [Caldisphaera lagunensis DSM 15908]|uniref:Imidazolonepropionase n=1 Tax=Caldisphaera lagunensis (strain DSM 15908 / JCM 11604 / ANMR 0165 / IC-154) TaxID=1056495 RepID=L0A7L5_CALLD|nr:imidazolonepropionase [Caldisphaera lagunensis]AFZ69863.1 imidazolonepropionase [Caldisphaera lagunensis DSM 15908]